MKSSGFLLAVICFTVFFEPILACVPVTVDQVTTPSPTTTTSNPNGGRRRREIKPLPEASSAFVDIVTTHKFADAEANLKLTNLIETQIKSSIWAKRVNVNKFGDVQNIAKDDSGLLRIVLAFSKGSVYCGEFTDLVEEAVQTIKGIQSFKILCEKHKDEQ